MKHAGHAAHGESKRTRPSPGKVFDHYSNACKRDGTIAWSAETAGEPQFTHTLARARELWARCGSGDQYIDVHCWRFTLESFHLVLSDLQGLGLSRLAVVRQFPTHGCEFYMQLARVPEAELRPIDRRAALEAVRRAG